MCIGRKPVYTWFLEIVQKVDVLCVSVPKVLNNQLDYSQLAICSCKMKLYKPSKQMLQLSSLCSYMALAVNAMDGRNLRNKVYYKHLPKEMKVIQTLSHKGVEA